MEGVFPRNVRLRIIIKTSSLRRELEINVSASENEKERLGEVGATGCPGQNSSAVNGRDHGNPEVIDSFKCRVENKNKKNSNRWSRVLIGGFVIFHFGHISMLKRSYSMEFESDQFTPKSTDSSQVAGSKENDESGQMAKKMCNSGSFEERKSPAESPETSHGRGEHYRRYSQGGDNAHVTQSRSIFSHEDGFVYGNPKEDIKNIENPTAGDALGAAAPFESNSSSVLDLSCKGAKPEEEKPDGNTYQSYQRTESFPRSNLEIKLVNPVSKKPSIPEQLQIAKIQQQQRRSMQQQQKFLQQMRRSLDPKGSGRQDPSQSSHKNVKYYGNSTTNHDQNDLDNHARVKDEFQGPMPGTHFPQLPYPYFDPNHPKELPDNHPILPLLDPVYFSALYNAHGFLPPSSPSIAAAFIGTLQDALPKLPMMFPSTSSGNSPLLPQKSNENPN